MTGSQQCLPCPAGMFCNTGSKSPTDCYPGAYCPKGIKHPESCPPGTYSNSTNLQEVEQCAHCPPGRLQTLHAYVHAAVHEEVLHLQSH